MTNKVHRRIWPSVILILLLLFAGGLLALNTVPGHRQAAQVARRLGYHPSAPQVDFAGLLEQGRKEYLQAPRTPPFSRPDYPTRDRLLQHRPELLAAIRSGLNSAPGDPFCWDLLIRIGGGDAKTIASDLLQQNAVQNIIPGDPVWTGLRALFTPDELKQLALTLPGHARFAALQAFDAKADPAFLAQFLLRPGSMDSPWNLTNITGIWTGVEAVFPKLDQAGKLAALSSSLGLDHGKVTPALRADWQTWLATETDPAVRQELLYRLGDGPGLMAAIEKDGIFRVNSFWRDWRWEYEMRTQYPGSFLAKGIAAYETIRGRPYFDWDIVMGKRVAQIPPRGYGNRYYDPDREIPAWQEYLKTYSKHEAAGDAAYRLGRSYEIKGQYGDALRWLYAAAYTLPTGDMAYPARERLVWILDAEADEAALRTIPTAGLPSNLVTAINYSIALRELRAGQYEAAVSDLDNLPAASGDDPLPQVWPSQAYPFWTKVQQQRAQAATLRDLAASAGKSDDGRYSIAAVIYHDEFIFYNHLWAGGRQGYYAWGGAAFALQGDMSLAYSRWAADSNNYVQAIRLFDQLAQQPGTTGEKAAFSRAMALTRLLDYSQDIALWRPTTEIWDDATGSLERFAQQRPESNLAPDALLTLAYLKRDPALLQRILQEYPDSDAAVTARTATLPKPFAPRVTFAYAMPFEYVSLDRLPPELRAWAEGILEQAKAATANLPGTVSPAQASGGSTARPGAPTAVRISSAATGSITRESYTYIMTAYGASGQIDRTHLSDSGDGSISVASYWSADPAGPGYALFRIPATTRPIVFK